MVQNASGLVKYHDNFVSREYLCSELYLNTMYVSIKKSYFNDSKGIWIIGG